MVTYLKASDYEMADNLKCLCHGNSGAGKTYLGATAVNPILALCELQGLRTIRRVNPDATVVMIDSTEDLRELLADLRRMHTSKDGCPYDTVVLDSLTEMQRIIKSEIIEKAGSARETPTQGEWGIIIDRTINVARAFRDLPMHVLVLTLSEEQFTDEGRFIRPSVSGKKLPNDLAGFFNLTGYVYKRMNEDNEMEHRVLFDGIDGYLTKGDPDLSMNEIPHWPSWVRRCYNKGTRGAAPDKNFVTEKKRSKKQETDSNGEEKVQPKSKSKKK